MSNLLNAPTHMGYWLKIEDNKVVEPVRVLSDLSTYLTINGYGKRFAVKNFEGQWLSIDNFNTCKY